jgi:hypothetical protein
MKQERNAYTILFGKPLVSPIKSMRKILIYLRICCDHLTWIILAEKKVMGSYLVAFSPRVIPYYQRDKKYKHYKHINLLKLCNLPAYVPTVK